MAYVDLNPIRAVAISLSVAAFVSFPTPSEKKKFAGGEFEMHLIVVKLHFSVAQTLGFLLG
jgi:hypothetical protein